MKNIKQYTDMAISSLMKKTGSFWAFGDKQFEEQRKEGVEYVSMGAGLICPKDNAKELREQLDNILQLAIELDLKENGKDAIIERELSNRECYYTGNWIEAFENLGGYGVSQKEVVDIYLKTKDKYE